jgi:hypothetical protein
VCKYQHSLYARSTLLRSATAIAVRNTLTAVLMNQAMIDLYTNTVCVNSILMGKAIVDLYTNTDCIYCILYTVNTSHIIQVVQGLEVELQVRTSNADIWTPDAGSVHITSTYHNCKCL